MTALVILLALSVPLVFAWGWNATRGSGAARAAPGAGERPRLGIEGGTGTGDRPRSWAGGFLVLTALEISLWVAVWLLGSLGGEPPTPCVDYSRFTAVGPPLTSAVDTTPAAEAARREAAQIARALAPPCRGEPATPP